MKLRLIASHAAIAALLLAGTSCTDDWGQVDPPAGNQVYPTLQKAGETNFDDEGGLDPDAFIVVASTTGETPEIVNDAIAKSSVLQLNQGTVSFANPLASLKCQNAASFTLWMHQPMEKDEEGNTLGDQDLTSPVISFVNDASSAVAAMAKSRADEPYANYGSFSMSAGGKLDFNTTAGSYSVTVPVDSLIPGGDWHYVAVTIKEGGYAVAVDGEEKANETVEEFDFMSIVEFMNNASTVTLGSLDATQQLLVDDVNIYRNALSAKETKQPKKGDIGKDPNGAEEEFAYPVATKTEIGASDCTAAWWTEFSDYYSFPGNTALHLSFVNHTSGGGNWNNWNLCVSTNAERGGDGYTEYFVIRSDLYGWGGAYDGANWSNEGYGDWDAFRADMEGAYVTIDIVRTGVKVEVTAIATAPNGTVYKEMFWANCEDEDEVLNAFLIVDGSYLEMDAENTYYYTPVAFTKTEVGASDCSAAWWTEFSDYYPILPNKNLQIGLTNHTSGGGNWNNWNLCVCAGERDGEGYAEYFVIRSDLYGWGNSYNGDNWSNEGYGDWDAFRADMEGAKVVINIARNGEDTKVTAVATAQNGNVYKEVFTANTGDEDETINAFFIADGSCLEMNTAQYVVAAFK